MKVAVIGAGTMGAIHLGCYSKMENIEMTLCEIDEISGKKYANLYDINWTNDYNEILNSNVDIIDICLPTYLHENYVIQAAQAGKHVFCEKPIAISEEAALRMKNACQKAGVTMGIGMVLRFFPEYQALAQRYKEGLIGKAAVINAFRGGGGYPKGWNDWYSDDDSSSSLVVDLLIHDVDFIQWVFGDVETVYATRKQSSSLEPGKRYQIYSTIFQLEDGTIVSLDGSWYQEERFYTTFEVSGSEGILAINPDMSIPIVTTVFDSDDEQKKVAVPESPLDKTPFQLELEDFVQAIREKREPKVSIDEAIKALKVTLKMFESAKTGNVVKIKEDE